MFNMDTSKVIFTNHALERGRELGFSEKGLRNLLVGTERLKTNFWREAYKFFKYGLKQGNIAYYYRRGSSKYPPLLFTIEEGEAPVVITVTLKKGRV